MTTNNGKWIFQTGGFNSEAAGLFIKISCSLILAAERMQSEKTIAAHQGIPPAHHMLVSAFFIGNQIEKRKGEPEFWGAYKGMEHKKHFR